MQMYGYNNQVLSPYTPHLINQSITIHIGQLNVSHCVWCNTCIPQHSTLLQHSILLQHKILPHEPNPLLPHSKTMYLITHSLCIDIASHMLGMETINNRSYHTHHYYYTTSINHLSITEDRWCYNSDIQTAIMPLVSF